MTKLLKKYKKAIGGAISTGVTYVVVTKLGLPEDIAITVTGIVTGVVVAFLKNTTKYIDEALSSGAAYVAPEKP